MMGIISQHHAMMQSMMQNSEIMGMMTNQDMMGSGTMGSGTMGSGIMSQGKGMMSDSGTGQMMIQDPELREQFNQYKLEHQKIMNELMSADMSDPAI
jgi:hypothetical protein